VRVALEGTPWSAPLAYAVGLIATDGCLSSDLRHVSQVSKDRDLLETFKACIGSTAPIGLDGNVYRVQIGDVVFHRWLQAIGLTPRKSLTLGRVAVPDPYFLDFARGLLDGDGSVIVSTVTPTPRRYPEHRYERLRVQFHSASQRHIEWLQMELSRLLGLRGWIGMRCKNGFNPLYVLRYSKHEAIHLLEALYRDPTSPRLARKWAKWTEYRDHRQPTRAWSRRGEVKEHSLRNGSTNGSTSGVPIRILPSRA
jgi:hypothetical protein